MTRRGGAGEFHALALPETVALEVWVFEVERPALVVGSAQRVEEVVDVEACRAAGVEVVRRRSGGGAVLLEPGGIVWFDVIVPADRLRREGIGDDVAGSMVWLGKRVVAALTELGIGDPVVHAGPMVTSPSSALVCFAGIGPGEVLVDGSKLVGISQRRTRAGARYQCAVHTRWSPDRLAELLLARPSDLPDVATLPPAIGVALPGVVARSVS
ncbi:MAG: lipoate--protein ligase family protein [Ilumatobacteraceae bacterium]